MTTNLSTVADEDCCYLTTTGRVTGRAHTIEIWFVLDGDSLYMLSERGTQSDWVKNMVRLPAASVRIAETTCAGQGRVVTDEAEDALARRIMLAKYQPQRSTDLTAWGASGVMVAVDMTE